MNKIIRFYNQNRRLFWVIVLTVIIVIALVQTLNNYYKNNKSSGIENTTTYNNTIQKPTIVGEKVSQETSTETMKIIDEFINYCNRGDAEKAYEFLSNDCKEQGYQNLEKFKNNYCNDIFDEPKLYSVQSWITNSNRITYRITITEDILATGNTQGLNIEDYYTIVKEDNQYKLNIHGYVGKEVINKSNTENDVTFNVIEKYIYMEYEIYKINVKNASTKKIMIDSKENTRSVNVLDQNNLKYVAFLNEINEDNLVIYPGISKDLDFKINKSYNPKYVDKYIEFSDIVLDIENENNRNKIKIEF